MHGIASLAFASDSAGVTRLTDLEQRAPLRVLFPRDRQCGIPQAVLVTTGGGLVGGDRHEIAVTIGEAAAAMVTTQAAEKVYRSTGADTRIAVTLEAAAASWVEWMPQETILFDGSRLDRRTEIDLAPTGRFFGGEMLVFGRTARGESLTHGFLRDAWRVRIGGRLVWADTLLLEDDIPPRLTAAAGFDRAIAVVTLVYAGQDAAGRLEPVRANLAELGTVAHASELRLAASCVNGLLIVRGLARDPRQLRWAVVAVWRRIRSLVAALPPGEPRIWLS